VHEGGSLDGGSGCRSSGTRCAPDREVSSAVLTPCRVSQRGHQIRPSSQRIFPTLLCLTPLVAGLRPITGNLTSNIWSRSRACWLRRKMTSSAKIYGIRWTRTAQDRSKATRGDAQVVPGDGSLRELVHRPPRTADMNQGSERPAPELRRLVLAAGTSRFSGRHHREGRLVDVLPGLDVRVQSLDKIVHPPCACRPLRSGLRKI